MRNHFRTDNNTYGAAARMETAQLFSRGAMMQQHTCTPEGQAGWGEAHGARQVPQQENNCAAARLGTPPASSPREHMEDGNLHNKKAKVEEGTWRTTR